jgi:transposase
LHVFEPKTRTVIDLESFIPEDHLLRQIDRIVEPAFIRKLTTSCYAEGRGRPSIDPVVYFRMQLVAYLYGIDSDRRLCEEVHFNLAYRWFCRLSLEDEVPDHSSFSRIRDRYGEKIYEQVFHEIVKLCQQHGLVAESCSVMTDATLIAADASLNSLIHNDTNEANKEVESQQRDRGLKDGSSARRVSNKTHTSHTDPDATLAQKPGTPRQLKYKVHQSIDADSRVILDTYVTTGARHDNQPYLDQLQRIEHRYKLTIHEVTADRGYGSAAIIHSLQEQGKQTFIPLWSGRVGNSKYLKNRIAFAVRRGSICIPILGVTGTTSDTSVYRPTVKYVRKHQLVQRGHAAALLSDLSCAALIKISLRRF